MINIDIGEIEFFMVIVKVKGKVFSYCWDSKGILKFSSLKDVKVEVKWLIDEFKWV